MGNGNDPIGTRNFHIRLLQEKRLKSQDAALARSRDSKRDLILDMRRALVYTCRVYPVDTLFVTLAAGHKRAV